MTTHGTGDRRIDAYLAAGGGEAPFLSRAMVVVKCREHGTNVCGLFETEIGGLVAVGSTYSGENFTGTRPRKAKLPAGWNLDLRIVDDMTRGEVVVGWCHVGGGIEIDSDTLRTAWANRRVASALRVRHVAT